MGRRPTNSPYTITTEFGVPDNYAKFLRHSGTDYGVAPQTHVFAPTKGIVIYAQFHSIRGNMVGIFDGENTHRLMHNSSFCVSVDQQVEEGQLVALSGSTGLSTGPHVHWDIVKGCAMEAGSFSSFIDPWDWLEAHTAIVKEIPAAQLERLAPYQRKVGSVGVNHRDAPNTVAYIRQEWAAGEILDFQGYVIGERVADIDKWFVGKYSGGFLWAGSFNDTDTHDLPDLTAKLFPVEDPAEAEGVPIIVEPPYEGFIAELDCVDKVVPAHRTNYEKGNFPLKPTEVVIHDYGTDGRDTTGSAHNTFRAENTTAPHFSVDEYGIYQHGKLSWRMYHAGPLGNDKIGIEVHPDVDTNPLTAANLVTLLVSLDNLFGKLKRHKHSEFMATACGDDIKVESFWLEAMYPAPVSTTTTTASPPQTTTTTTAATPQQPTKQGVSMKTIIKAIAGFIAGFVTVWLAKHNIIISDNLPDVIEALLGAILVGTGVYFAPRNKEKI